MLKLARLILALLALASLALAQSVPPRVVTPAPPSSLDSYRIGFAPSIVYRVNRAKTNPTDWVAQPGNATVSSANGPDYTQGAGTLSTAYSGTQYKRVTALSRTFSVGDWLVYGVWVKASGLGSPTAGATATMERYAVAALSINDGTNSFRLDSGAYNFKYVRTDATANTRWQWVTGAAKVTSLPFGGAGQLNFDLLCDLTHAVSFYAPTLQIIDAGTLTDAEVSASLLNFYPVPDGATQGSIALLKNQKLWVPQISDGATTLMVTVGATGLLAAQAIPGGGGGSGTVTSFSAGSLSPLFTSSVANSTTTPALTFSLSNAAAHTFFGNNTGSTGAPAFSAITAADVPGSALTKTDDTNVTLTLGGSASTALLNAASLTLGWTGALAKARQHAATVYNDAGNTYSTGAQDFSAATALKVPISAGFNPTTSGLLGYDSTSNTLDYGANGTMRRVVNTDEAQTLDNKTLITPTIASFVNAAHNHTNAAGGGQLTDGALSSAVTVAKGGTGLTGTPANGQLPIGNGTGYTLATLSGTTNRVGVTSGSGSITLNVGSLVVQTDQGNTYSTGGQDFSAATSLKLPSSAGAAPTTTGTVAYDSTTHTLEYGMNSVNRIVPVVFWTNPAQKIWDSTAIATSFFDTTPTIPANWLDTGRTIEIKFRGMITTGATAPTLKIVVKLGSNTLADSGAITMTSISSQARTYALSVTLTCITPGSSGGATIYATGVFDYQTGSKTRDFIEIPITGTAATTTSNQALNVQATFGTASASNSIEVDNGWVIGYAN